MRIATTSVKERRQSLTTLQLNIDDGFLNLMSDDGVSKDDVKVPDSEVGQRIEQMFNDDKDVSKYSLKQLTK